MNDSFSPSLLPRLSDPLWFNVDRPCNDESELDKLEEEYKDWITSIATQNKDIPPIGQTAEQQGEEEEEEEEEEDGDDDSDSTNDDELDTDMIEERESPEEVEMEPPENSSESPPWGL